MKSRTILSLLPIEATVELPDSLCVPLKRFDLCSFEGWIRCQNTCWSPDFLLVMDGFHFNNGVLKILAGEFEAGQRILVFSSALNNEITDQWSSVTQIGDKLWLLEGPPASNLRCADDFVEPSNGWPKISVIIISYNQADYIVDCLDSILGQGYPNLEIIVVDGDSTDGTREILESYRKRFTHLIIEPDKCQSDALNKGFMLATGDLMTWVCSDDLLEPDALFYAGRAFAENNVALVAGGCRIINADGKSLYNHHNGLPLNEPVDLSFGDLLSFRGVWERGMYFYQPELFFSKRIWKTSGGYIKEHLHFAMDYDLFLRFAMAGAKIIHIPQYLAIRRVHKAQKTQHETMSYLPTIRYLLKEYRGLIDKVDSSLLPDSIQACVGGEVGTGNDAINIPS